MAKEKLDQMLCVPLSKSMKEEIQEIAEREERKPADMGRVLWREAIEVREQQAESTAPRPGQKKSAPAVP